MRISNANLAGLFAVLLASMCVLPTYIEAAEVKVGVDSSDWKPMSWIENTRAVGYEVDVVMATLEDMGYSVEWKPMPWARLLTEVKRGTIDAAIGIGSLKEREAYLRFPSEPTYTMAPILVGRDHSRLQQALHPSTTDIILTTNGYSYGVPLDDILRERRTDVPSQTHVLEMLARERAHYGLLNVSLVEGKPLWSGLEDFKFAMTPVRERGVYVAFSRAAPFSGLSEPFSDRLRAFRQTDAYLELRQKYFAGNPDS